MYGYKGLKNVTPSMRAAIRQQSASASTIPLWNFTTGTAYDGNTYSGQMVGRSPFFNGHRATQIPTFVIPVILTIHGEVFDPTAAQTCSGVAGNPSVDTLLVKSPIFKNVAFTMNGASVGTTQYLDAFQRANFWTLVQGTPYHTLFTTTPTVLSPVSITVPNASSIVIPKSQFSTCKDWAIIDINWWLPEVENTILPALAPTVGTTSFPQFIFESVGMSQGTPSLSNCCILGFHDAFFTGSSVLQTFSTNDFDISGAFGTDTDVLSHEVAEWMDDPEGINPTPSWGNEGQVVGNCQGNLEVGDPLSQGFGTPTTPFTVTMGGFTYHLQELAFYSWFFGDTPSSLGSGGKFSDNSTFGGHAIICPPGGTN